MTRQALSHHVEPKRRLPAPVVRAVSIGRDGGIRSGIKDVLDTDAPQLRHDALVLGKFGRVGD